MLCSEAPLTGCVASRMIFFFLGRALWLAFTEADQPNQVLDRFAVQATSLAEDKRLS